MKRVCLIWFIISFLISNLSWGYGIVNNSGSSSEDSLSIPVLSLDSLGNPTSADSFFVVVFKSHTNDVIFSDSGTTAMTGIDTAMAGAGITHYYYHRAVADIDGSGAVGQYAGVITAKHTTYGLLTSNKFSFQITSWELDDMGDSTGIGAIASLNAIDSLADIIDSLYATLDSLQNQNNWLIGITDASISNNLDSLFLRLVSDTTSGSYLSFVIRYLNEVKNASDSITQSIADANKGNYKATGFSTLTASDIYAQIAAAIYDSTATLEDMQMHVWANLDSADVDSSGMMTYLKDNLKASGFSTHNAADVYAEFIADSNEDVFKATGFSTHAPTDVWNFGTRGLTENVTLADGYITAAKIAADAIGASELASDAVTEIDTKIWGDTNDTPGERERLHIIAGDSSLWADIINVWRNFDPAETDTSAFIDSLAGLIYAKFTSGSLEDVFKATGFSTHSALDVWNIAFSTGFSAGSFGDSLNNSSYVQGDASGLTASEIIDSLFNRLVSDTTSGSFFSFLAQNLDLVKDASDSIIQAIADANKSNFKATGFSTHSAEDVWNVAFTTVFTNGSMGDSLNNPTYVQGTASGLTAAEVLDSLLARGADAYSAAFYHAIALASDSGGAGSSNWTNAQRDSVLAVIADAGKLGMMLDSLSKIIDSLEAQDDWPIVAWSPLTDNDSLIVDLSSLVSAAYAYFTSGENENEFKADTVTVYSINANGDTLATMGTDQQIRYRKFSVINPSGDAVLFEGGSGGGDPVSGRGMNIKSNYGNGVEVSGTTGDIVGTLSEVTTVTNSFSGTERDSILLSMRDGHFEDKLWSKPTTRTITMVNSGGILATSISANAITADKIASNAIGADELATTAVDEIVDGVADEPLGDHTTAGSLFDVLLDSLDAKVSSAGGTAEISDADMAGIIDTLFARLVSDTVSGSFLAQLARYITDAKNAGDSVMTAIADANKDNFKATVYSPADIKTALEAEGSFLWLITHFWGSCDGCYQVLYPNDGTSPKDSVVVFNSSDIAELKIRYHHSNDDAVIDSITVEKY